LDAMIARPVEDDREHIREGDRVLLIIEDDVKFAGIMVSMAHDNRFKAVVATRGDTGLALANELQPDAISLDIHLPILDGWSVLDRLKRNPRTRHIPVHVISVLERGQRGLSMGAFAYLEKPVSKESLEGAFAHMSRFLDRAVKRLLVVEDNDAERGEIARLIGEGGDVEVTAVNTAEAALTELKAHEYDCMVVDLILANEDGARLVEEVKANPKHQDLPIIVYTQKDLTDTEEQSLKKYAHSIIMKSGAQSTERLLQDTSLFLHRVDAETPKRAKTVMRDKKDRLQSLKGRTVLVVDDDVRNIFAMSSVLENRGLRVLYAENGKDGIETLAKNPNVDVVLMDLMMPEMDGYETMRAIRNDPKHKSLPIIAVTAKALKEDRDKCLAAGASGYLPKPVDIEKLFELIGLWAPLE
jgi:CheY-like chemotaxis protein